MTTTTTRSTTGGSRTTIILFSLAVFVLVGLVSLSSALRGIIGCQTTPLQLQPETTTTTKSNEIEEGGRKASPGAKWLNAIHVSTETDVLLMRFYEYDEFVDEFHIFETNITQWGTSKPRHFQTALQTTNYYDDFRSKITYHDIPPIAEHLRLACVQNHTWDCELHFRRYVGRTMNSLLRPRDVLLTGDADEIASASTLQQIKDGEQLLPARIKVPVYKYSLHWLQGGDHSPSWVCDGRFAHLFEDYNTLRELGQNGRSGVPNGEKFGYYNTIAKAGWHASSFGTIDQIAAKMNSIIEGVDRQHSREVLEQRIRNGTSTWDPPIYFTYLEIPPIIPRIAIERPDIWKTSLLRFGREEETTESLSQQQTQ